MSEMIKGTILSAHQRADIQTLTNFSCYDLRISGRSGDAFGCSSSEAFCQVQRPEVF